MHWKLSFGILLSHFLDCFSEPCHKETFFFFYAIFCMLNQSFLRANKQPVAKKAVQISDCAPHCVFILRCFVTPVLWKLFHCPVDWMLPMTFTVTCNVDVMDWISWLMTKKVENEWKSFHLFTYSISSFFVLCCCGAFLFISCLPFSSIQRLFVRRWQFDRCRFFFFLLWNSDRYQLCLHLHSRAAGRIWNRASPKTLITVCSHRMENNFTETFLCFFRVQRTNCVAAVSFIKWESALKNQTVLCKQ